MFKRSYVQVAAASTAVHKALI
ncbi:hypothetical protein PE36_11227 [Moritella sp. PE36]|nr:hypothetical protein PE36_11227 [Moritella sp. PE36]